MFFELLRRDFCRTMPEFDIAGENDKAIFQFMARAVPDKKGVYGCFSVIICNAIRVVDRLPLKCILVRQTIQVGLAMRLAWSGMGCDESRKRFSIFEIKY